MFNMKWLSQFYVDRVSPRRKPHVGLGPKVLTRYAVWGAGEHRCVDAATKSEARAVYKRLLGVPRLPPGCVVVPLSELPGSAAMRRTSEVVT